MSVDSITDPRAPVVMVVDDDLFMGRAVACILTETRGAEVHLARTGDEALPLAEALCPDLILIDVRMPGMAVGELCRRLRALDASRPCALYLHTGILAGDDALAELADQVQGTISKPPDPVQLLRAVDEAMAAGRGGPEGKR